jgi:hypothetical protein
VGQYTGNPAQVLALLGVHSAKHFPHIYPLVCDYEEERSKSAARESATEGECGEDGEHYHQLSGQNNFFRYWLNVECILWASETVATRGMT